jgi:hypothetical protein
VRRSEYIFEAAVAARGRPFRRVTANAERILASAFLVARADMVALEYN